MPNYLMAEEAYLFQNNPEEFLRVARYDSRYDLTDARVALPGVEGAYGVNYILDDDSEEMEEGMDVFDNDPGVEHRSKAQWKQLIDNINRPSSLKLQGAYEMEKEDKKHRMGDLLQTCFEAYNRSGSSKEFYTWLDDLPEFERVKLISNHGLVRTGRVTNQGIDARSNIKPSMVKAFMKGVAYLDDVGRKKHRVKFVAGVPMMNGKPLDTTNMETVFAGRGFCIWVISKQGKMYAGNHKKGLMHHSSFLAGGKVMCGGEMMAQNGQILFISAKTGHYQAGIAHLKYAISILEVSVKNWQQIKVLVGDGGRPRLVSPADLMFGFFSSWVNLSLEQRKALQNRQWSKFA